MGGFKYLRTGYKTEVIFTLYKKLQDIQMFFCYPAEDWFITWDALSYDLFLCSLASLTIAFIL